MKTGAFIIPYFGKFNNYFPLFLNSCRFNPEFDWLLFTDDRTCYDYPENVIVTYLEFDELREKLQSKFEFKIALEYPYKLCDFRAAYGFLFEEYIKDYRFWGYCDTDLIWGRISNFIVERDLTEFDKIGIFGHCSLIRNNEKANRAFMKKVNGCLYYQDVFSKSFNCSFDEEFSGGINNIFEALKLRIKEDEYEANIYTKSSDFRLTKLIGKPADYYVEPKRKAFFCWEKGILNRYELLGKQLKKTEYMYLHMQARPMKAQVSFQSDFFKIIPNSFEIMETMPVTIDNFCNFRMKHFNLHYFKLRWRNLKVKVKNKLWPNRRP